MFQLSEPAVDRDLQSERILDWYCICATGHFPCRWPFDARHCQLLHFLECHEVMVLLWGKIVCVGHISSIGPLQASCRNYCMLFYIGFFMAGELICFSTLDTKFDRPTESIHPIFGDFQTCSKVSKLELERWEVWSLRFYESMSILGNSDTL